MGERKVLINYIPPDFDPSIIPKQKRDRNKLIEVRTMLPFSIRCLTCGEYMYRGKKFNSSKECIVGETYLGIRKMRFYIKCSYCSAEIVFKTDPKNSDYEMESGASRNFEVWRSNEEEVTEDAKQREEEETVDAMKALENKTLDSRIEMDVLDALDEIKAINQRHERVNTDALLAINSSKRSNSEMNSFLSKEEEDALVKSVKFKSTASTLKGEPDIFSKVKQQLTVKSFSQEPTIIVKRRKREDDCSKSEAAIPSIVQDSTVSSLSGLMEYGSSGSDAD